MKKIQFQKITDGIWQNRNSFFDKNEGVVEFDYPDYGGLPIDVTSKLSPESVDAMQSIWIQVVGYDFSGNCCNEKRFKNKRQFASSFKNKMKELGEVVL